MNGAHRGLEHLLYEVKKVVVGQDHFLERVLVALLAGGHLLVEGVPGLAKTLTVATLAKAMHGSFKRIQFTPDLVPADLTGMRIFNQRSSEFVTMQGPVFANLVLAERDQPRAGQGAERVAGSDAGTPGYDRGRNIRRAQTLHRDGDPEPHRDRGHLRAARGAGGSFHDEGRDRLSQRRGRVRHRSTGYR